MAHKHQNTQLATVNPSATASVPVRSRTSNGIRRSFERLMEDFDRDFFRAPFRTFVDLGAIATVPAAGYCCTFDRYFSISMTAIPECRRAVSCRD